MLFFAEGGLVPEGVPGTILGIFGSVVLILFLVSKFVTRDSTKKSGQIEELLKRLIKEADECTKERENLHKEHREELVEIHQSHKKDLESLHKRFLERDDERRKSEETKITSIVNGFQLGLDQVLKNSKEWMEKGGEHLDRMLEHLQRERSMAAKLWEEERRRESERAGELKEELESHGKKLDLLLSYNSKASP